MDDIRFWGALHLKREHSDFVLLRENGTPAFNFVHFFTPMYIVIDGHRYETSPNACIIYKPGTRQEYRATPAGIINNFVTFSTPNEHFVSRYNLPTNEIFYIENEQEITSIVEYIAWALTDNLEDHISDLHEHLDLLMRGLAKEQILNNPRSQRNFMAKRRFVQLREEMQKAPCNWTVEKMAAYVYLTRSRFSVLYHEYFGVTPSADIIDNTLEQAAKLLHESDVPIHKVAQTCGYDSTEHFVRLFKKKRGVTPGQYRKKIQKE